MAIDEVPQDRPVIVSSSGHSHTVAFVAIFIVLAFLAVGEIVTLNKMGAMRDSLQAQRAQMQKDFDAKLSTVEESNAQQLGTLRVELDQTAERMGATGKQLNNARAMVARLQKQQQRSADELKEEISQKADEQKVGALTQDVSATKTDLDTTKKNVDTISHDLGMAKSEFGTLIAKNHDDIETLRKLGERDYFEFTLNRNERHNVAGVGLVLKKTNVKHNRFDLTLLADDQQTEKKARTINEPIMFYIAASKRPFELVVNKVQSNRVTGYISAPKGATEEAGSRTAGGQ